jgi:hypothetical protein
MPVCPTGMMSSSWIGRVAASTKPGMRMLCGAKPAAVVISVLEPIVSNAAAFASMSDGKRSGNLRSMPPPAPPFAQDW